MPEDDQSCAHRQISVCLVHVYSTYRFSSMIEPDKVEERDELIPESAKEILVPALKFGAFTGELWCC